MLYTTKSGTEITVTSTRGNKPAPWNPSGEHYRVTVTVNGKRTSFDFWDSAAARLGLSDDDLSELADF